MQNTKFGYMYRDADNYKYHGEVVLTGAFDPAEVEAMTAHLNDDEFFIPSQVGLEDLQPETLDPQSDHPWHTLGLEFLELTNEEPTETMTWKEFVTLFCSAEWDETPFNTLLLAF